MEQEKECREIKSTNILGKLQIARYVTTHARNYELKFHISEYRFLLFTFATNLSKFCIQYYAVK